MGTTSKLTTNKIKKYITYGLDKGILDFIPPKATNIRVCKLSRLSGGIHDAYMFSVAYLYESEGHTVNLVLKFYSESNEGCQKEYRVLKALEEVNFSVPHVYLQETDEKFFGVPFVIMEKVEGRPLKEYVKNLDKKAILNVIKRLAETLAFLHELDWNQVELGFLSPPENEYSYARKQGLWENELPDYVEKRGFQWATNWLKTNASKCPCNRYSLLHNDMNMKNFLITKEEKIIFLDWEWAEIGDPLKDVGYAYHNIRHMFGLRNIDTKGVEIALYFLKQYIKSSKRKIDSFSLRFYIFSAGLREAIYLRHVSNLAKRPSSVSKIFGAKYLPFFALICWHYRSRYKHLERFLRNEGIDYEQAMFGTAGGKLLSKMEIDDILRLLDAKPSELILDVGTGPGRIARQIVSKTGAEVIGIDVGRPMIQLARVKKGNLSGYETIVADGQHLPFEDESFDEIVCIRTLKYFKDYILGISEMARVLKPKGKLVVDLSSILGYETILRHITHLRESRGFHVFNFYKVKALLVQQKLSIVDVLPLQKIPYKIWNLSTNSTILQLLIICENVFQKMSPLIFSRSVLLKCMKN